MEPIKTIILNPSVTVGSQVIAEIQLREPIVNEVITSFKNAGENGATVSAYEAQIYLASSVSGISIDALEELPTRILDEAIEYLTAFQDGDDESVKEDQWDMKIDPPLQLLGSDGDILDELSLKEPTVGQRKKAMKQFDQYGQGIVGGLEFQVTLLTEVTGQKMATILKLPMSQFTKANNYLMRFFPDIKKTGKSLSSN